MTPSTLQETGSTPSGDCHGHVMRDILDRVGDRWSMLVIHTLSGQTLRFNELRSRVPGITQKMLTQALRGLERDGLVSRTAYLTIPPKVEYALTPSGRGLLEPVSQLMQWAATNEADILAARIAFDGRKADAAERSTTAAD